MRVDHNEEVEVYDDLKRWQWRQVSNRKRDQFPFDVTSKRSLKGEANIGLSELSELSEIRLIPISKKYFYEKTNSI